MQRVFNKLYFFYYYFGDLLAGIVLFLTSAIVGALTNSPPGSQLVNSLLCVADILGSLFMVGIGGLRVEELHSLYLKGLDDKRWRAFRPPRGPEE